MNLLGLNALHFFDVVGEGFGLAVVKTLFEETEGVLAEMQEAGLDELRLIDAVNLIVELHKRTLHYIFLLTVGQEALFDLLIE